MILAGYSRGDAALNLGCAWENARRVRLLEPEGWRKKDWRDIPAVILVPQMDGDVDTLDGYAYLGPRWDDGLKSPHRPDAWKGRNHNFFNASLSEDDDARGSGAALTPVEQQDFLCRYLADFCEAAARKGALLDAAGPAPGRHGAKRSGSSGCRGIRRSYRTAGRPPRPPTGAGPGASRRTAGPLISQSP